MSGDVLLRADHVSKKFCRSLKRSLWYGVNDMAAEVVGGRKGDEPLRRDEFWAVNDVSLELRRGECLGLIGHNGAGKTTLLRILNGLVKPDRGVITLRGRVAALIALGAGFNPVLTGRENVYVNGAILGMSKREIDKHLDEIIDFAEIRESIDAPVQSYSSGMTVRLGFAIATTLDPDILLLDEVLAVGDASFRHKCYNRLAKLLSRCAVILVSHSMDYVGHMCNRVVLMKRGQAQYFDDPGLAIREYLAPLHESGAFNSADGFAKAIYPPLTQVDVRVTERTVPYGGRLVIEADIFSADAVEDVIVSFSAVSDLEQTALAWSSIRSGRSLSLQAGAQRLRVLIEPLQLHEGAYRWNFHIRPRGSIDHIAWLMQAGEFRVTSDFAPMGNIPYLPLAASIQLDPIDVALAADHLRPAGTGERRQAQEAHVSQIGEPE